MIYLELLFSFFKIGLFSFGGGYAMIPLMQKEIQTHGWISLSEFVDIIAIAEMTPGPISVNSATYIGYKTAGLLGSATATMGVALPSVILILAVSNAFFKYQGSPVNTMVFYGVRPAITGLIASAGLFLAKITLIKKDISFTEINTLWSNIPDYINLSSLAILSITLIALIRYKLHPIITIAGAGIAGLIINYI